MKNTITKEFSNKVVNMSLLCAFLVVSIHCGFAKSDNSFLWWLNRILSGGYSGIAVPFFFLISGYFISGHIDESGWWSREVGKRIKSLVVPFFVWAIISQVCGTPLTIVANVIAERPLSTNMMLFNGKWAEVFGLVFDKYPALVPMWFLRALFFYVLSSWIIVWCLRKMGWWWIALLFTTCIGLHYCLPAADDGWGGFLSHGYSIGGLMYFSVGIYVRIKNIHYNSSIAAKCALAVGLLFLSAQIFIVALDINVNLPLTIFFVPCFMFCTWHYIPAFNQPKWLKGVTFPIYLMHGIVLMYWTTFATNVHLPEVCYKLIALPLAFFSSLGIALFIRCVSKRWFSVLFGGR